MLPKLFQTLRIKRAFARPQPDRPIAVIGDVHGCHDLLQRLLKQIPQDAQIILVGDYIDRGPNSAEVLRFLQASPDLICLKGNHEDMLLQFLDAPAQTLTNKGQRWIKYGGGQTLTSFGLTLAPLTTSQAIQGQNTRDAAFLECRNALIETMGTDLIDWLKSRPVSYRCGNIFIAHAGGHPKVRLDQQDPQHLVWGHPEFTRSRRRDGIWVAHGHVIHDQPTATAGRIAVDTGAYATGVLSAAYIATGADIHFLQATG